MPATVVRGDASPKLLLNGNVPFPPTVFFTTVMDPVTGAMVLLNVQVAGAVKEAGVPFVQLELVRVQPAGTVSARLLTEPGSS